MWARGRLSGVSLFHTTFFPHFAQVYFTSHYLEPPTTTTNASISPPTTPMNSALSPRILLQRGLPQGPVVSFVCSRAPKVAICTPLSQLRNTRLYTSGTPPQASNETSSALRNIMRKIPHPGVLPFYLFPLLKVSN